MTEAEQQPADSPKMEYDYLATPNPDLICAYCLEPCVNPYIHTVCGNSFCYSELATGAQSGKPCPKCKASLQGAISPSTALNNMCNALEIKCKQCDETMRREQWTGHTKGCETSYYLVKNGAVNSTLAQHFLQVKDDVEKVYRIFLPLLFGQYLTIPGKLCCSTDTSKLVVRATDYGGCRVEYPIDKLWVLLIDINTSVTAVCAQPRRVDASETTKHVQLGQGPPRGIPSPYVCGFVCPTITPLTIKLNHI